MTRQPSGGAEYRWVIAYDVPDDTRRRRLAKLLEGHGERIQYSVFECHLNNRELRGLRGRVAMTLNLQEDQIRYYRLCQRCSQLDLAQGSGEIPDDEGFYIV